jgi:hypothetical protein
MGTPEQVEAARENLAVARLERAVRQAVDSASPVPREARERLALLLLNGDAP